MNHFAHLFGDLLIAFPLVGTQARGAVFDAVRGIDEIAAAVFPQGVEGAVAEEAGEGVRIGILVAGEVFAIAVLKEIVGHGIYLIGIGSRGTGWVGEQ